MILLKVSNASDLVASKLGQIVERLTPDSIDQSTVEDLIVNKMIESLSEEGIKGEISSVTGVDFDAKQLSFNKDFNIRSVKTF